MLEATKQVSRAWFGLTVVLGPEQRTSRLAEGTWRDDRVPCEQAHDAEPTQSRRSRCCASEVPRVDPLDSGPHALAPQLTTDATRSRLGRPVQAHPRT